MVMSVIAISSNKLFIGKTYWKNVAFPDSYVGYRDYTLHTKQNQINSEQKIYLTYRYLVSQDVPQPAHCGVKCEIRSSDMESRYQTTKVKYMRNLIILNNIQYIH